MGSYGVIMKCGCAASGSHNGKPVCVCHVGLTPDAEEPMDPQPDLSGRMARCKYFGTFTGKSTCHGEKTSSELLPFFRYTPDKPHDEYYCGCFGWE